MELVAVPPPRHFLLLLGSLAISWVSLSTRVQSQTTDLSTLSLDQLSKMHISVSSFARKDQDLWVTPAAVYVITKEDIANSTATSIPELLRVVPGLQVAQLNASSWAISARGFNSEYSAKLLVLIDGRTVYSEIYSGSHWDQIDLPIEMIERIEVIRGPGAVVWGTNAVNGVINIIKKPVRTATGPHISGHLSRIDDVATLSYASRLGQRAFYGGYIHYIDRKPFELASGVQAFDGASTWRSGARIEWQKNTADWITASADIYGGHLRNWILPVIAMPVGPQGQDHESIAGGYMLSRWEHRSEKTSSALQVYYDDQSRHELGALAQTRTMDIDYQNHIDASRHHDIVWGSELRYTANHLDGAILPTALPDYRNYLINTFLQDEIALIPRRFTLTLGSKIQTGTLAGFQLQPSIRLLFAPDETQSLWAAGSRAAVAPSVEDIAANIPLSLGLQDGIFVPGRLQGNPDFKPQEVRAYEAGYRRRIGTTLTVDLATFFNDSRRVQSMRTSMAFQPGPLVTFLFGNGIRARSEGLEAAVSWKPRDSLSLKGSYSWTQAHATQVDPGALSLADPWNTPGNTFTTTVSWNPGRHWNANGFLSRVGCLPASTSSDSGLTQPDSTVPAYTRMDFHLTRKIGNALTLDAGGTNLLAPRHIEFGSITGFTTPEYVPRSLSLKGTWSF